ncbi:site-specific DNA-methyltransferase [Brucella endophytica]|uniref:site-specific DNA-methyltransferase (adenine-specific) n=1 Tax=Brucella endophytica TaxID=1963359 RepID=A0A916WIL9_9HYPH|nr:site-specific DNA-methyltransferase [Brucella endophytica]GGB03599.1 site-specific DNA-methyltransferase [Brucella endophytica]
MPTLDWIGKKAVVNHHREVPYRLVHCSTELSTGDPDAGNLLVQGDNLEALKALLPYYAGKVKCIYIDPPYNTGKSDWRYNDRVTSPEITAWLGKTVGKESEDLSRHDKWLCMMYPRLRLLREFMRKDAVIFVSCDDNEQAALHIMMAEIFGRQNHLGTAIWKNATDNNPTRLAVEHEYILIYAKDKDEQEREWAGPENDVKELMLKVFAEIEEETESLSEKRKRFQAFVKKNAKSLGDLSRYKQVDERGVYVSRRNLENPGKDGYQYDILHDKNGLPCARPLWGWRFPWSRMQELLAENRIVFGKDEKKIPELKAYLKDVTFPFRSVFNIDSRKGSNDLEEIFGRRDIFRNPKSVALVSHLLSFVSKEDDIILDSFCGSGTTAHAVLELNNRDQKKRKFICIEMDEETAKDIAGERLKRVILGYNKGGDPEKPIEGYGGGFRFCRLGVPLFNEFGDINSGVSFSDLAAHIFFSETGLPLPKRANGSTSFLGTHREKAVFLLFSPAEQGFPREVAGNVLTPDALANLSALSNGFEGVRVVYAEGCTVSPERLKAEGIVFKQIPYQIEGN